MTMRQPLGNGRATQSGVSLIEVMIAMVLSMVLLSSIVQIFTSTRQTNRVHNAISRMQENGRMALEVISRDVRMSDFWNCVGDITDVVNNLNSANEGFIDFDLGGISGSESEGGLPDILVLRGGVNAGLSVEPPFGPQASANLQISTDNGFEQGDIIFVSDCTGADIFQISNANPSGSGQLVHNTGSTVSPGNYNATNPDCPGANAHCLSKVYAEDASIFAAQQITYMIGTGSEGPPALFRNGQEFVDGIENFQVLYGEDTDGPNTAGSGIANYYVPADQVVDMNNVISIRFAIVALSYEENLNDGIAQNYSVLGTEFASVDTRLRQVYTSTVTIRNRL